MLSLDFFKICGSEIEQTMKRTKHGVVGSLAAAKPA